MLKWTAEIWELRIFILSTTVCFIKKKKLWHFLLSTAWLPFYWYCSYSLFFCEANANQFLFFYQRYFKIPHIKFQIQNPWCSLIYEKGATECSVIHNLLFVLCILISVVIRVENFCFFLFKIFQFDELSEYSSIVLSIFLCF